MKDPPNSSPQGSGAKRRRPQYKKIRELGRHPEGTRITYLAKDIATEQQVAIKQFVFAKPDSEWAGFKAYKGEIEVLRHLDCPGIPPYLAFLPGRDGFCTVREYKEGKSLAEPHSFGPEQIQQIAISTLTILVDLQSQTPPVIHGNIKPENILVDGELNVELVDFGFPFIDKEGARDNRAAGTPGFMPREQLRDDQLVEATDLYALGATLVCLMGKKSSSEIGSLVSQEGYLNVMGVLPKEMSFDLAEWLEKMLQPYPKQRYENAVAALEALQKIVVSRSPEVKLSANAIELTANEYGDKLTEVVIATNEVPGTVLKGRWQLAPHPSEPSQRRSSRWISFTPPKFKSNKAECQISVDTSKLMANSLYEREIVLETNTRQKTHSIQLKVQTPRLINQKLPLLSLFGLLVLAQLSGFVVCLLLGIGSNSIIILGGFIELIIGFAIGGTGGMGAAFNSIAMFRNSFWAIVAISITARWVLWFFGVSWLGIIMSFLVGLFLATVTGYVIRHRFGRTLPGQLSGIISGMLSLGGIISLLLVLLGVTLGIGQKLGYLGGLGISIVAVTTILLVAIAIHFYSQQAQSVAQYRKRERNLVKP